MNKIEVNLKDKNDFTSKYNENRISNELYNYITNEVKLTNIKEQIKINIIPNFKMTDKEKEQLALNIKKTSKEEIDDIIYLEQKRMLKELIFLLIGIIVTTIWFFIRKSELISEIILIIGWLFIWEAVRELVFSRTENMIKIKRLKQIIKSDIDFID